MSIALDTHRTVGGRDTHIKPTYRNRMLPERNGSSNGTHTNGLCPSQPLELLDDPLLAAMLLQLRRRHANPQEEDERHTASSSIPMCPLESGVVFLSAFWSCRPLSLARHLAALSLPRSPRRQGEHPLGT